MSQITEGQANYLFSHCLHPSTWTVWIPDDKYFILEKNLTPYIPIAIGYSDFTGWFCVSKDGDILYIEIDPEGGIPEWDLIEQSRNGFVFAVSQEE